MARKKREEAQCTRKDRRLMAETGDWDDGTV